MGVVENITADSFPKQGALAGKRVRVCFHYDTSRELGAVVVRDDAEKPYQVIFRLDDGRHVLASECQYRTDR